MERIITEDMWCGVRRITYSKPSREQKCIHCKDIFTLGDKVVLLVNNYKFFPNCLIHVNCMDKLGGTKKCIKILRDRYKESERLREEADKLWNNC